MTVFILKVNIDGKIVWTSGQRAKFSDFKNERRGKMIRLKLEDFTGNVSEQMRGYYWGAIIPWVRNADEHWESMTDEEIHELLKKEFNSSQLYDPITKKKVKIGKSLISRGVKTDEAMATIARIADYFIENYNTMPPQPDPMQYKIEVNKAVLLDKED